MTALVTETTRTFCAGADTHEASEVFHVEHRGGHTGQRVELARYTVASGDQRILYGQRVDGVVRVTDVAAHGHGRAYLVERGLEQDGYAALKATMLSVWIRLESCTTCCHEPKLLGLPGKGQHVRIVRPSWASVDDASRVSNVAGASQPSPRRCN
jgi:hypothetical protein